MVKWLARKKKKVEGSGGSPAWMATFSDLMNLLLCFFVLLFSMSSVDAEKFGQVVASLSNSFSIFTDGNVGIEDGPLISNGMSQLNNLSEYFNDMGNSSENQDASKNDSFQEYKEQMEELQQEITNELYEEVQGLVDKNHISDFVAVGVDKNYEYIKISMHGAILFDSGKADIKTEAIPTLSKIGDILKIYDDYLIKIEGHTDNVPVSKRSPYKNNMWLSTARASTVWEYLTNEKGLNPKTLESSGRSEYDPITDNSTPEGRDKNRRVEIKIFSNIDERQ